METTRFIVEKKALKVNERSDPAGKSAFKFFSKFFRFFTFLENNWRASFPGTRGNDRAIKVSHYAPCARNLNIA